MKTEETKDNGTEGRHMAFDCGSPEDFKKMFKNKCACFCDQVDAPDFSSMKEGMMKKMMKMCSGVRAKETSEDTQSEKRSEE